MPEREYNLQKRENKNIQKKLKFERLGHFFMKCKHVGEYGFGPYGFLTAIKTKHTVQLVMLLFAFAFPNLHHKIKYMKGSGRIRPLKNTKKPKSLWRQLVRAGFKPLFLPTGQTC